MPLELGLEPGPAQQKLQVRLVRLTQRVLLVQREPQEQREQLAREPQEQQGLRARQEVRER